MTKANQYPKKQLCIWQTIGSDAMSATKTFVSNVKQNLTMSVKHAKSLKTMRSVDSVMIN